LNANVVLNFLKKLKYLSGILKQSVWLINLKNVKTSILLIIHSCFYSKYAQGEEQNETSNIQNYTPSKLWKKKVGC
jgi:hypothetical protein